MAGDPKKIPPPPKYASPGSGSVSWPKTLADAVDFTRWLVRLWRVASVAIDAPEALTITPRPIPTGSEQNVLGAAQAFSRAPIPASKELDAGTVQSVAVHVPVRPNPPDELTGIGLLGLTKPPYPLRKDVNITTIEDQHATRTTSGNATWSGFQITRTPSAGALVFQPYMVGKFIAIDYANLYRVVTYIDPDNITIDTNLGIGGGIYYFTMYPAVTYPKGSFFWELDRTLLYLDEDSTGTCNTAGMTVNRVSGDVFDPYWASKAGAAAIVINGISYAIDHTTGSGQLILKTSAGVQAGVSFSVTAGKWSYILGTFAHALSGIPRDVGINDHGLLFFDTTYWHLLRFDFVGGPGYQFAPGDDGSSYIVAGTPSYAALYWAPCDGSTVTVSTGTGSTTTVVTPNMTGDVFIKGASAQGAQQAATRATWEAGAKTEDEAAHTHVVDVNSSDNGASGSDFNFAHPGMYTSGPGSAHHHDLIDANAQLKVPSEANGGLPLRISVRWWIRL